MMATACRRCGRPSQATICAASEGQSDLSKSLQPDGVDKLDLPCQRCKDTSFRFDQVFPLWAYLDRVRDAIVAAKYAHQAPLSDALGRRLAGRLSFVVNEDRPDVVTFVPSHFTRQFTRGGNSNLTTATAVATGIGRPCRQLLRITRHIEKQAWLEEAERANNVRGAFALKKSYAFLRSSGRADRQIADQHILLVDDVMTTGATANEVAGVLKDAGARRVTLAVVARAVGS
jgi:predicted amidophosphoribosyltransferase